MKTMGWIAAASVLALAGCSSSGGSGGGGPITTGPTGGVAGTVSATGVSDQGPAKANVAVGEDDINVAFTEGVLTGRTMTFVVDDGDGSADAPLRAVATGETADLTVLFDEGNASFAGLIIVDDDANAQQHFHAFYGGNPNAAAFSAPESGGTLKYEGAFVGVGALSDDDGDLRGKVTINANFTSGDVDGTIDDLRFAREDGTTTAIGDSVYFEAKMSLDNKATYSGSVADGDVFRINGDDASDGLVEGGFFGPGASETAGAIFAQGDDGMLVGGYHAHDVTP